MNYLTFKKQLSSIFLISSVWYIFSAPNVAYAQLSSCAGAALLGNNPPALAQIVCPFVSILNAMILIFGAVFTILIVYALIKLALSFGDPKGFESSKVTAIYAGMGLAVVLGLFGIFSITFNILGVGSLFPTPLSPFAAIITAINNVLTQAQVFGP